jgi:hypothetical protein
MPLPAGAKLGPCGILAPIGAGDMGEVYKPRDPRLGRDVDIIRSPLPGFPSASSLPILHRLGPLPHLLW